MRNQGKQIMLMKKLVLMTLLTTLVSTAFVAQAEEFYLSAPDLQLTPGDLCKTADELRYPEQIIYCKRDVSYEKKQYIFKLYMEKYKNFHIDDNNRYSYKVDHYIPLCMGGSNEIENLWPQYKNIYDITDEIESALCQELAVGNITQKEAIEKIRFAKNNVIQIATQTDLSPINYILKKP